jgi:hypothetical protein
MQKRTEEQNCEDKKKKRFLKSWGTLPVGERAAVVADVVVARIGAVVESAAVERTARLSSQKHLFISKFYFLGLAKFTSIDWHDGKS